MEMIKNSPQDCYATVQRMTMIILERLNQVLALEGHLQNSSERAQFHDLQGLLCATLQVCLFVDTLSTSVASVFNFQHFFIESYL